MKKACSLAALVISLVALTNAELSYTCVPPQNKVGPKIPQLADEYVMKVEANIVQSQKTIEVFEAYDFKSNMVAVEMKKNGEITKSITDFNTLERFYILPNGSCVVQPMNGTSQQVNIFFFTAKGKDGSLHIASVSDVFKVGAKYNISYIGQTTIRGIPVNHWSSCQDSQEFQARFKLDYYFSRLPYVSADGDQDVPVRFQITGQAENVKNSGMHNFTHVYEFTMYKPGPIRDRSHFETPRGSVCKGSKSYRPLPRIPNQFSMNMEIDSGDGVVRDMTVLFDYEMKLVKQDTFYWKHSKHRYGAGTISKVDDFGTGVEYIMNRDEGNCTIGNMSRTLKKLHEDSSNITMLPPQEILRLRGRTFLYQGKRVWRGLPVDAWANITHNMLFEIYFRTTPQNQNNSQPAPGPTTGQGPAQSQNPRPQPGPTQGQNPGPTQDPNSGPGAVIVGAYLKNLTQQLTPAEAGKRPRELFVNVYNFKSGHPEISLFDVESCFGQGTYKSANLQFTIEADYDKDFYGHRDVFLPPLRNSLAKAAKVEVLRIAGLKVERDPSNSKQLVIRFRLLDLIPLTGNVASPAPQTSLDEAKKNLAVSAKNGLGFFVDYPQPKAFRIKGQSLSETTDQNTSQSGHYSSGAMAGLGVAMVVFGIILGLIITFIIHRRVDTEVPYKREQ